MPTIEQLNKEFKAWCESRGEANPRIGTLRLWLTINYPEHVDDDHAVWDHPNQSTSLSRPEEA